MSTPRLGRINESAHMAYEALPFAALYPDFGNSYFFFYVFGHNDLQSVQAGQSR